MILPESLKATICASTICRSTSRRRARDSDRSRTSSACSVSERRTAEASRPLTTRLTSARLYGERVSPHESADAPRSRIRAAMVVGKAMRPRSCLPSRHTRWTAPNGSRGESTCWSLIGTCWLNRLTMPSRSASVSVSCLSGRSQHSSRMASRSVSPSESVRMPPGGVGAASMMATAAPESKIRLSRRSRRMSSRGITARSD